MNANITIVNKKTYKLKKFAAYCNPEFLYLLKGKIHLCANTIFKVCRKIYEKMLVVMVCDL